MDSRTDIRDGAARGPVMRLQCSYHHDELGQRFVMDTFFVLSRIIVLPSPLHIRAKAPASAPDVLG